MFLHRTIEKKIELLGEWFNLDPELGDAGCLLVGYEAFRAIVLYDQNKKANRLPSDIDFIMEKATEYLLKPGKSFAFESTQPIASQMG